MDRTLNRAKRYNQRRSERNFSAWQRFSYDGETCFYCPHDKTQHLMSSGQPHFYRPATEAERNDLSVALYRHNLADGDSVLVRRMTVSKHSELVAAFCKACAKAAKTSQVLCYQRTRGVGEVIGMEREKTP